jgi:tetratricopeptide (TPR) repeat protein
VKFPAFLLGTSTALVCISATATAQTPTAVLTIARSVTVEINLTQARTVGSGVIIHQQGNLYTLITNRHVVCGKQRNCTTPLPSETFQLKFGDGSSLKVSATAVRIASTDLDLATIQFRSQTAYQIAKIAPPDSLKVTDRVYTSGYPLEPRGYSFNSGVAIAVVTKRLNADRGGYTIVYNAETQPGMSGGGVFDKDGRIVAIHGQGERYQQNTSLPEISAESGGAIDTQVVGSKIGYNRGIPIRWVVQGLARQGIALGNLDSIASTPTAATTADEHFIAGFNKFVEPGAELKAGKRQAIALFDRAIRLDPRYAIAYFMRGNTYNQLQEYRLALADFDRAIALVPQEASAYNNRGALKAEKLNDLPGALSDYNRAIEIEPRLAETYYNRGLLYYQIGNMSLALADYDRSIAINSQDARTYYNRALTKGKLNDAQGALADYDRAIDLNPEFANAYYNRANLKTNRLNDNPGALVDYDRSIELNPKFASAYNNRGSLKEELNDLQGALADYSQAIERTPKDPFAYNNRGLLKRKLKDAKGALVDYDRAIGLDPKYAAAYYNRGLLKADEIDNPRGAVTDFDRAIAIDPQNASAYGIRGAVKYIQLNDRTGGIADTKMAARLAKTQGDTRIFNIATQTLESWGVRD